MGSPEIDGTEAAEREQLDFEIAFYEAVLKQVPDCVDVLMALSNNYTRRGQFENGLRTDQRLCELRTDDPIVHYNLACSYSLLGHYDQALEALRVAVALGYRDLAFLQQDPDLEGVRSDPRYPQFLASVLGGGPAA